MTLSAFIGYFFAVRTGSSLIPVIIVSMLAGDWLPTLANWWPLENHPSQHITFYYFVSSITLGTLYEGIVTIWVGPNFYNYPRFFESMVVKIGDFVISKADLIMFFSSALALALLVIFIQKTRLGRALRSVSFDRSTAGLMGINVFGIIQLAFFISGALAGLSGVFLGINYTLYPQLGNLVVKGFIASVIGGLGSIFGAVVGAILLGLTETLLINFVGSGYAPVFSFVIMLAFLLIRPQGIAGSNVQEKA